MILLTSKERANGAGWLGRVVSRGESVKPHRIKNRTRPSLPSSVEGFPRRPDAFLADKGYDSDALVATLEERGITPVISPKANRRKPRKTDFALYRERNLVERFFCKIMQYRAISMRYDQLANTFLAAVALVCVLFWLN